MKNELISIVMPAFNAEKTIMDSIQSVIEQSYTHWELLICDDSSTDNTKSIVNSFKDSRIKLIENSFSKGAAGARNSCLEKTAGRFVSFLDSDDLWHKNKLKRQLSFMIARECYFSFCNYNVLVDGRVKGCFLAPAKISYNDLLKTCSIGCLTVMLDKKFFQEVLFPYTAKEDYYLWLKLLQNKKVCAYNVNEVLATYRISEKSISANKFKEIFRQWKVLSRFEASYFKRVYYLCCYIVNGLMKQRKYRGSK